MQTAHADKQHHQSSDRQHNWDPWPSGQCKRNAFSRGAHAGDAGSILLHGISQYMTDFLL